MVMGAVILVGITIFLYYVLIVEAPDDAMTVAFLDVGQGDATFVEAPSGRQMLIDGGEGNHVLRELGKIMPFWDRSIDIVIATHPDQDHIGGLVEVLRRFQVDALVRSGVSSESGLGDALVRAARENGVEIRELRTGDVLHLSPAVHFDVLFPPVNPEGMDTNDASLIGRLVYGKTAVLFSGDASTEIEEYVTGIYSESLKSDVVKVGHHGSETSTAAAWLGWSDPEHAVISAGEDNRHGHPHPEVVERLKRFEVEIIETAKEGTVVFESNGRETRLVE